MPKTMKALLGIVAAAALASSRLRRPLIAYASLELIVAAVGVAVTYLLPHASMVLIPLVACIVWLGVYPAPVLRRMEGAAERFVSTVNARRETPTTVGDASGVSVGNR